MKFWAPVLLASSLFSALANAATLVVTIGNIKTDVGQMNVAVYDNEDDWLGDEVVAGKALVPVILPPAEALSGRVVEVGEDAPGGDVQIAVAIDVACRRAVGAV